MTEANPLNLTRREILSELTEEFRKTQRAIRNLKTEKRQIQVSRIRNEKALEKLERQINEQEDRLENALKEPDKQENARQDLERLKAKKQQLLDEQGTNAGKSDELDNRLQEMEQKKTTAQKKVAELENYLAHKLFSMVLSRLAFFFMSMGFLLILVGLAGANWHGSINLGASLNEEAITGELVASINEVCENVSVCGLGLGCLGMNAILRIACKMVKFPISNQINSDKWKGDIQEKIREMEGIMNQAVENKIRQLLQSVSEFLIVIGLGTFIIFGACWIGLERRKILNLPMTVAD